MAVNPKELRIGNYVNFDAPISDEGKLTKIGALTPTKINAVEAGKYLPIPLTEEWLLKFGFEFKSMGSGGAVCSRHSGHWYKDGWPIFFGSKGKNFDCFFLTHKEVEIPFVHQLQNLYYALTGQELTA